MVFAQLAGHGCAAEQQIAAGSADHHHCRHHPRLLLLLLPLLPWLLEVLWRGCALHGGWRPPLLLLLTLAGLLLLLLQGRHLQLPGL
jgi:hypothetical protein